MGFWKNINAKGVIKITAGIILLIVGFIFLITPFTPGAIALMLLGLSLLGFEYEFLNKNKK